METIRNYLESMFASLPNTPEVLKAKDELLQMMEDKYNELLKDGKSENEAVGTVISEFGNLEELADDLGIRSNMPGAGNADVAENGQLVTKEEAQKYLK
ncbi:MAG: permease prefix domain 1-containing protein, partial [Lachnospiraceae bacterium]|nr:permease prefix domain 1-containing protein [Lachnospiraceae bacterium]